MKQVVGLGAVRIGRINLRWHRGTGRIAARLVGKECRRSIGDLAAARYRTSRPSAGSPPGGGRRLVELEAQREIRALFGLLGSTELTVVEPRDVVSRQ